MKLPVGAPGGRCYLCGCTEEKRCDGGCTWAVPTKTLCTRCAATPVFTLYSTAIALVSAVSEVQVRLYQLEKAWSKRYPELELELEPFSQAYAEAARLFAYLSETTGELLEALPDPREGAPRGE